MLSKCGGLAERQHGPTPELSMTNVMGSIWNPASHRMQGGKYESLVSEREKQDITSLEDTCLDDWLLLFLKKIDFSSPNNYRISI